MSLHGTRTESAIFNITSLLLRVPQPQAVVDNKRPTADQNSSWSAFRSGLSALFHGILSAPAETIGQTTPDLPSSSIAGVEVKAELVVVPMAKQNAAVAMLSDPKHQVMEHFPVEAHSVLQLLMAAFEEESDSTIRDLRGEEAQKAVDIMQEVLTFTKDNSLPAASPEAVNAWRLLRRRLHGLSHKAEKIPTCYTLQNVQCPTRQTYGVGGYADVYQGVYDREHVAMKYLRVFKSVLPSEARRLERGFYRETVLWYNLSHPHVMPFKGVSNIPDIGLCMISPWMEHGNLRQYLEGLVKRGLSGDKFIRLVNKLLYQIALGLDYLHNQDLVHGDLRSPNVLVDSDGAARLADFGITVIAEVGQSYTSLNTGGAVGYAAPELIEAERPRPTTESDIYAFGHVFVELYSGHPPYHGLRERQIPVKILKGDRPLRPQTPGQEMSDDFWNIAEKCWHADPLQRPKMSEVLSVVKRQHVL